MAGVPTRFQDKNATVTAGIIDLVNGVIEDFDQDKVEQTSRLAEHPGMRRLWQGATPTSGGPIRSDVRIRETRGFKWTSLLETRALDRQDLTIKLTSEPVHSDDGYFFDVREEAFTSGKAERVFDHLEQQDNGMVQGMWDNWEDATWSMPIAANSGEPFGVPAFLRTLAIGETGDGSFNGITAYYGNGTSTTLIGGQDANEAANARLRSYAGVYEGNFHEGVIGQITRAMLATKFSYVPGVKTTNGTVAGGNAGYLPTEQYAQAQEYADKVIAGGPDASIAPEYNEIRVRGMILVHCPSLSRFAHAPMFFINARKLKARTLNKFWLRRLGPNVRPNTNGLGVEVGIASSGCLHCTNPREAGFTLHKVRAA